jgi:hypothetical protein
MCVRGKNIRGALNFIITIFWHEISDFKCGCLPIVDLLGSNTVHDNKMLKHPPEQNSVTLKTDTTTPSEIRNQLLSYPVKKKTQKTILKR